jgi:DnaJ-class molecular chaperone
MRCPRCGGSGQLRTGHGGYRTCLDCAARGILGNDRRAA